MTRRLILGVAIGLLSVGKLSAIEMDTREYRMLVKFFELNENQNKKIPFNSYYKTDWKNLTPRNLPNSPSVLLNFSGLSFTADKHNLFRLTGFAPVQQLISEYRNGSVVFNAGFQETSRLKFPENFFSAFPKLKYVVLNNSGIKELPPSIVNCPLLEELSLTDCFITKLPNNLDRLTQLEKLAVEQTNLQTLPQSIGNLTKLKKLYLGKTQLKELPKSFFELTQLQILQIDGNSFLTSEDIPNALSGFSELRTLLLSSDYQESCVQLLADHTKVVPGQEYILDKLPNGSRLEQFDGSTQQQGGNVLLAFKVQDDGAGNTRLMVADQEKYKEIQSNIDLTVIKFTHPKGDFFKRYAWNAKFDRGTAPSSPFDDAKCPAPDFLFMPQDFEFKLDRYEIKVGEESTPDVQWTEDTDENLQQKIKERLTYSSLNESTAIFDPDIKRFVGLSEGKVEIQVISGNTIKTQVLEVVSAEPKLHIFAEDTLRQNTNPKAKMGKVFLDQDGIKKRYLRAGTRSTDLQLFFQPANPYDYFDVDYFYTQKPKPTTPSIGLLEVSKTPTYAEEEKSTYLVQLQETAQQVSSIDLVLHHQNQPTKGDLLRLQFFETPRLVLKPEQPLLPNSPNSIEVKKGNTQYLILQVEHSEIFNLRIQSLDQQVELGVFEFDNISPEEVIWVPVEVNSAGSFQIKLQYQDLEGVEHEQQFAFVGHIPLKRIAAFTPSYLFANQPPKNFSYQYEPTNATTPVKWLVKKNGQPTENLSLNENWGNGATRISGTLQANAPGTYSLEARNPLNNELLGEFEVQAVNKLDHCSVKVPAYQFAGTDYNFAEGLSYSPSSVTKPQINWTVHAGKEQAGIFIKKDKQHAPLLKNLSTQYQYQVEAETTFGLKCKVEVDGGGKSMKVYKSLENARFWRDIYAPKNNRFFMNLDLGTGNEPHLPPIIRYETHDHDGRRLSIVKSIRFREDFCTCKLHLLQQERAKAAYEPYTFPNRYSFRNKSMVEIEFKLGKRLPSVTTLKLYSPHNPEKLIATGKFYLEKTVTKFGLKFNTSKGQELALQNRILHNPVYMLDSEAGYKIVPDPDQLASLHFKNHYFLETKTGTKSLSKAYAQEYQFIPKDKGLYTVLYDTYNYLGISGHKRGTFFEVIRKSKLRIQTPKLVKAGTPIDVRFKTDIPIKTHYGSVDYQGHFKSGTTREVTLQKLTHSVQLPTSQIKEPDTVYHQAKLSYFDQQPAYDTTVIIPLVKELQIQFPNKVVSNQSTPLTLHYQSPHAWTDEFELMSVTQEDGSPADFVHTKLGKTSFALTITSLGGHTITFIDKASGVKATHQVSVLSGITQISLEDAAVKPNQQRQIKFSYKPLQVANPRLKWRIVGENYGCTVSPTGLFSASQMANGKTVKVEAATLDGSVVSNPAKLEVKHNVERIEIKVDDPLAASLHKRKYSKDLPSITMKALVFPAQAFNKSVTWSIQNSQSSKQTIHPQTGVLQPNGTVGSVTVIATANDGSGVVGRTQVNFVQYPESLELKLPQYMLKGMPYPHQTIQKPNYNYAPEYLKWGGDTKYFTIEKNRLTPQKVGKYRLERQHLLGYADSRLRDTQQVQVVEAPTGIQVAGKHYVQTGNTETYTASMFPKSLPDTVVWSLATTTGQSQHAEARINSKGMLETSKPGWISVEARTPQFHPQVETLADTLHVAVLPRLPHTSSLILDLTQDTAYLNIDKEEFRYQLTGVRADYFTLSLQYHDRHSVPYQLSQGTQPSAKKQVTHALKPGFVAFNLHSAIDPNYSYLRDTLTIMPDTNQVSYDTLLVGQAYDFEHKKQQVWKLKSSLGGVQYAQQNGFDTEFPDLVPSATGSFVAWRVTAGTDPVDEESKHVHRVDSVRVYQGITGFEKVTPPSELTTGERATVTVTRVVTDYKEDFEWQIHPQPTDLITGKKSVSFTAADPNLYRVILAAQDGSRYRDTVPVEFYRELKVLGINDVLATPRDTILLGETVMPTAVFYPLDAKYKQVNWSANSKAISIEGTTRQTPKIKGLQKTNGSPVRLSVQATRRGYEDRTAALDLEVVRLVDSVRTNLPDTVYLGTQPTEFMAIATLWPQYPQATPSYNHLNWNEETGSVKIQPMQAAGKQALLQFTQAGRFSISTQAKDASKYLYIKEVQALKLITELQIDLPTDTAYFLGEPLHIQIQKTINADAYQTALDWQLLDEQGEPIPAKDAIISSKGILSLYSNEQDSIIILATANQRTGQQLLTSRDTLYVPKLVQKIKLTTAYPNQPHDYVYIGEQLDLGFQISPKDASNPALTWTYTPTDKLSLSPLPSGQLKLRGLKKGVAHLKVQAKDASGVVSIKQVEIAQRMLAIYPQFPAAFIEGHTYQLGASVGPKGAEAESFHYQLLYWEEASASLQPYTQEQFVALSPEGKLEIKPQTTPLRTQFKTPLYIQITATDRFGSNLQLINVSDYQTKADLEGLAHAEIQIKHLLNTIELHPNKELLYAGELLRVDAVLQPAFADNKELEWVVVPQDLVEDIKITGQSLFIKARAAGQLQIVAKAQDGSGVASGSKYVTIENPLSSFQIQNWDIVYRGAELDYDVLGFYPQDAQLDRLRWSLLDETGQPVASEIASIDPRSGVLRIGQHATGGFIVRASTHYPTGVPNARAEDFIRVHQPVTSIDITGPSRVPLNHIASYEASLHPKKIRPTVTALDWSFNNADLATSIGQSQPTSLVLRTKALGQLLLTATAQDEQKKQAFKLVEIYQPATKLATTLSGLSEKIFVGQERTVVVSQYPAEANSPLKYRILSGQSFFEIDGNKIKGVRAGLGAIEVTADDDFQTKDTLNIEVIVPVQRLEATGPVRMAVGETASLTTQVNLDATYPKLTFNSSSSAVSINAEGQLQAQAPGKATIGVFATDGSFLQQEIQIEVYQPVTRFSIRYISLDKQFVAPTSFGAISGRRLVTKDSVQLEITALPANALNRNFTIQVDQQKSFFGRPQPVTEGVQLLDFYSTELGTAQLILTATDQTGYADTLAFESVKWLENLKMDAVRKVLAQHSKEFIAPNLLDGFFPQDASNKSVRYFLSDPSYGQVDAYGNLQVYGKSGSVRLYAKALDGSDVQDSLDLTVVPASLKLRLSGDKNFMPTNYAEPLLVSSFPEGLPYTIQLLNGGGSLKDDIYHAASLPGTARLEARAEYFGSVLTSELEIELSAQTLYILDDTVTIKEGQTYQPPYVNYAREISWELGDSQSAEVVDLDKGLVTGKRYGYAKVYASNEVGSKDSVIVQVLLEGVTINSNIRLFPNPNNQLWTNVQLHNMEGDVEYRIYNTLGQLMLTGNSNRKIFRVNLPPKFHSGTYLFWVQDATGRVERNWFVIILE